MTMMAKVAIACAIITACGACARDDCDNSAITEMINEDIKQDRLTPAEYRIQNIRDTEKIVYVGLSQRSNPMYFRHYLVDKHKCKFAQVKIDQ